MLGSTTQHSSRWLLRTLTGFRARADRCPELVPRRRSCNDAAWQLGAQTPGADVAAGATLLAAGDGETGPDVRSDHRLGLALLGPRRSPMETLDAIVRFENEADGPPATR